MIRKQPVFIQNEKNYVALPMPNDHLVIAIPVRKKAPLKPGIIYNGRKKALFLHDKNNGLLFNRLDLTAQHMLKKAKYIHIAEIDYHKKQMKRDYTVPVKCRGFKSDFFE